MLWGCSQDWKEEERIKLGIDKEVPEGFAANWAMAPQLEW